MLLAEDLVLPGEFVDDRRVGLEKDIGQRYMAGTGSDEPYWSQVPVTGRRTGDRAAYR